MHPVFPISMANCPLEVKFAQNLAANEKKTRDKSLKKLKKYLRLKSSKKGRHAICLLRVLFAVDDIETVRRPSNRAGAFSMQVKEPSCYSRWLLVYVLVYRSLKFG